MATPLLRSETSFRRPGDYQTYIEGEALKRASYLASMDQFYAQLEETSRQFNETLEYKEDVLESEERMFGEELDETSRQFDEELDYNRWLATQQLELSRDELEGEERYRSSLIKQGERRLDISEKALEVERSKGGTTTVFDMSKPSSREIWEFTKKTTEAQIEDRRAAREAGVTDLIKSGPVTTSAPQSTQSSGDYIDPTYGWTNPEGRWF